MQHECSVMSYFFLIKLMIHLLTRKKANINESDLWIFCWNFVYIIMLFTLQNLFFILTSRLVFYIHAQQLRGVNNETDNPQSEVCYR